MDNELVSAVCSRRTAIAESIRQINERAATEVADLEREVVGINAYLTSVGVEVGGDVFRQSTESAWSDQQIVLETLGDLPPGKNPTGYGHTTSDVWNLAKTATGYDVRCTRANLLSLMLRMERNGLIVSFKENPAVHTSPRWWYLAHKSDSNGQSAA